MPQLAEDSATQMVRLLVDMLPPAQRAVIRYRYGFWNGRWHTIAQTCDHLHLSRLIVERLEMAAVHRLQAFFGIDVNA
jgi:DNA-directed RNA polymerase sigma subunit (sigma70/sigma32)